MALKSLYESKDAIPEGLSEHYIEQSDGSYKIDLEGGMKTQADVDKVMNALKSERDAHKQTKQQLSGIPDDFDADKWNRVKNIDPDDRSGNDDIEALKAKHAEELRKEREKAQQQINSTKVNFTNTLKEKELRDALIKNGVTNPIRLDDAVRRILRHEDVDAVVDDDSGRYNIVVGTLRDNPEDYIESWVDTEEGKYYVSANGNSGGGSHNDGRSNGSPAANPWMDDTFNMTEQARIYRKDPAKARKLAAQAGKSFQNHN